MYFTPLSGVHNVYVSFGKPKVTSTSAFGGLTLKSKGVSTQPLKPRYETCRQPVQVTDTLFHTVEGLIAFNRIP